MTRCSCSTVPGAVQTCVRSEAPAEASCCALERSSAACSSERTCGRAFTYLTRLSLDRAHVASPADFMLCDDVKPVLCCPRLLFL